MFLSKLALLAAESGGDEGLFDQIATRWNEGGAGMYPIALAGVVGIAIIVERIIVLFFTASINKDGFLRGLKKHIYAGDLDKAINYVAGQKPTPLTNVIKSGLMNVPKGEEEVQAALDDDRDADDAGERDRVHAAAAFVPARGDRIKETFFAAGLSRQQCQIAQNHCCVASEVSNNPFEKDGGQ